MNLSLFDAIDFFGQGGYLDTVSGEYIPPEYYLPKRQMIFPETPTPDYAKIQEMPERYIEAPVINSNAVCLHAALDLSVPLDVLESMGFSKSICQNKFFSLEESKELRKSGYSDEQWHMIEALNDYIGTRGLMRDFINAENAYRHELMRDWLKSHNFDITQNP